MRRISRFLPCCILLVLSAARVAAGDVFTVFSAVSLSEALREIGKIHEARTGDRARFHFAGSGTLARQIDAGAPADLFVSADEAQMDSLERAGRIDKATRVALLGNTLVVVTRPGGPALSRAADLAGPAVRRIAMGNPRSVPAGIYARKHLEKLGLWDTLRPKVVPTEHVRAALAAVAAGNAAAGIVYRTDATVSPEVRTAFELEAPGGPEVVYPAALVAGARNTAAASGFLQTLRSDAAGGVFRKHGFTVLGKE